MNVLDLFSGVGGFSLGLERAGMRTIQFCEIDPYCRAVLAKHWPGVPVHDDIRTLDGSRLGPVDLVCGGYPCQPFSIAGRRAGASDNRHLWPEMRRIVDECRPAWVCGENVAGHISMGLDDVLSDLEALGYSCRAFVIPACAVDAPHRRDRVWIVAHAECLQRFCTVFDAGNATKRTGVVPSEWGRNWIGSEMGTSGGSLPHQWTDRPDAERVADGVSDWPHRLRALGNAVVPQVVEEIGRAIMSAEAA